MFTPLTFGVLGLLGLFSAVKSLPIESFVNGRSIITFGDSLTHGLYRSDDPKDKLGHHPYSIALKGLLNDTTVVVEESGTNGARASELMYKLSPLLRDKKRPEPIFVVILAGTNDLGYHLSHNSIIWHLKKMHNEVQQYAIDKKRNVYTLAVAIPQLAWKVKQTDRTKTNELLKEYAERCNQTVAFLDFEERFDQTEANNAHLWSTDFVHFSRTGYDLIGHMVYNKIKTFLHTKTEHSLTNMDITKICE